MNTINQHSPNTATTTELSEGTSSCNNVEPTSNQHQAATIIKADHITKSYTADKGNTLDVLRDLSFALHEGEIVAILGRSGAGKSTFLRILAGLVPATQGTVTYRDAPIDGPNPGVALVFQTFALMPWLTVQDNVELGLQAAGVPKKEREIAALAAIDAIGLDGFETAYPKELSGGMRQRVGIARALVMQPDALFMDEPFSALDVLTAENLRQEVLKLWSDHNQHISSVLIVTHNIEEAVQMADRVVVLGSHPGHLIADVAINLPRPRDKHSDAFQQRVDDLYRILAGHLQSDSSQEHDNTYTETNVSANEASLSDKPSSNRHTAAQQHNDDLHTTFAASLATLASLDDVSTPGSLAGLTEVVYDHPQGIDLPDLAQALHFEVDDLFPLVDAANLLGIIVVEQGHIQLTTLGKQWREADILQSKVLFSQMIRDKVPLVRAIDQALRHSDNHTVRGAMILDLLSTTSTPEEMRNQFDTAIAWGRYAELFNYDADDDEITIDDSRLREIDQVLNEYDHAHTTR